MSQERSGLWSGVPDEGTPRKPLTYIERETLKLLWRFRDRPPGFLWLLGRTGLMTLILLPMLLIPGAVVAFLLAAAGHISEGEFPETTPRAFAGGAAVWLGLTAGFVVKDTVEVGLAVVSWRTLNRILSFSEIERRLHGSERSSSSESPS